MESVTPFTPSPSSGNSLLAALDAEELARIEPHLEIVELKAGDLLYEEFQQIDYAYFPHDSVLAMVSVFESHQVVEMTTIGREGLFGFVAALGSGQSPGRCQVQLGGRASRIAYEDIVRVIESDGSIRQLFLCYVEALLSRTLRLVACNAVHGVEERCCRSLLMLHDRVRSDRLSIQHEFLAQMLGVHRPSVSRVIKVLQTRGLIRQHRGSITILDREGLEGATCECYHVIRQQFERLLPHTYD